MIMVMVFLRTVVQKSSIDRINATQQTTSVLYIIGNALRPYKECIDRILRFH